MNQTNSPLPFNLQGKKLITILSGGMDSTTLAYYLKDRGAEQHFLSFNYGQRHVKEITRGYLTSTEFMCPHDTVDLRSVTDLFIGSSLTDRRVQVPEGHYAADTMKATIVPNRNAIMLSVAWGVAVAQGACAIAYGAHAGDHAIYPDCREEFVSLLEGAFNAGSPMECDGGGTLYRPFINISKIGILRLGLDLRVPYENTWSCYKGGDISCGKCGTCVERLEAFAALNVEDPLPYQDREWWRTAVKA